MSVIYFLHTLQSRFLDIAVIFIEVMHSLVISDIMDYLQFILLWLICTVKPGKIDYSPFLLFESSKKR